MSFFAELKRRNVIRVAVAYVVLGWLLLQVSDVLVPALHLPEWIHTATAYFLMIGFLPVVLFAWAFELTPDGLRRESPAEQPDSNRHETSRKLDFVIIGMLVLAVGLLLFNRFQAPDLPKAAEEALTPAEAQVVVPTPMDSRKAVAVLPFANLSTDAENEFFAAGVHEDILTYLSRVADLRVNSRTSVMHYAGSQQNLRAVAQALGAAYIVEGSVRRAGNRVRVTAQLIDASTDEHLWAENFDRELTDIFAIQTAVAKEIVRALEANLTPQATQLISARPTRSIEAYDLYIQARQVLQDPENPALFSDAAIRMLEEATRIDPDYALAWALLAEAHGDLYWFRADTSPDRLDKMRQAIDKAFALQPDLPEARLALAGYYYQGFYDYSRALEQLQLALASQPGDSHILYSIGLTLRRLKRYDESIDSFRQAMRADPAGTESLADALETASSSGRRQAALDLASQAPASFRNNQRFIAERVFIELKLNGDLSAARAIVDSTPEITNLWMLRSAQMTALWSRDFQQAAAYASNDRASNSITPGFGDAEAAIALRLGGFQEEYKRLQKKSLQLLAAEVAKPYAENFPFPHVGYARILSNAGRHEEAMRSCNRAMQILPLERDGVHGAHSARDCAWVMGMAGETDAALDLLETLLDIGYDMNHWVLTLSPEWDFMRDNPRFAALVQQSATQLEQNQP